MELELDYKTRMRLIEADMVISLYSDKNISDELMITYNEILTNDNGTTLDPEHKITKILELVRDYATKVPNLKTEDLNKLFIKIYKHFGIIDIDFMTEYYSIIPKLDDSSLKIPEKIQLMEKCVEGFAKDIPVKRIAGEFYSRLINLYMYAPFDNLENIKTLKIKMDKLI